MVIQADIKVATQTKTEMTAQDDIESSIHTNEEFYSGLNNLPCSLHMSIMWHLDYDREMYKYFILSYFYLLLIN